MRIIKKICSAAAAMAVLTSMSSAIPAFEADAASTVSLSPYDVYDINGGKFVCQWYMELSPQPVLRWKFSRIHFQVFRQRALRC